MIKLKQVFGFVLAMVLSSSVQAYKNPDVKNAKGDDAIRAKAANCAPATSQMDLDLNNVRARIEVAGRLYQNRAQSVAAYEVPKGSGQTAIYAGSVWMGGVDYNGQLKLAAATFGDGNEFWAGPLDTVDAAVSAETCQEYDRFYKITKDEVRQFAAWWECTQSGSSDCDNYQIPESILNWPAHGDVSKGQSWFLAPFYDRDGDNFYDPVNDGDYPYYDLDGSFDCQNNRKVILKGDETIWWVFNEKGNIHTESGGGPIGMEVHAQAFAFATNDEINDMTFLNFELINRGSQTLYETYFSMWIDPDIGNAFDDYVGCDVQRGLGYCYNGDAFDEDNGNTGYGTNPPAIGVDFFEGPYQDPDGKDNGLYDNVAAAVADDGIVYKGIGVGYGDGIPDNERYGMRKFIYYNNQGSGNANTEDPRTGIPTDFYNYMRGIWRNGDPLCYGGTGFNGGSGACIEADYMFPGDSDPLGWGTDGNPQASWSEQEEGNFPYDRRFLQTAGPFTLLPGAVNNLTVGVVYARANQGDPFAAVEKLRLADDKAQALFDNCFKIVESPDAPDLAIQEMDRELLFQVIPTGNNVNENFASVDPTIPDENTYTVTILEEIAPDTFVHTDTTITEIFDKTYRFQGYQVYQVKDPTVTVSELDDVNKAREVFQCDIKDSVTRLINFTYDDDLEASIPIEKVDGADEGLKHSFQVQEDMFAIGDRRLINHKTYHYIAVAYAHNEFKKYDQNDANLLDGQKKPYLASRRSGNGGSVKVFSGIPHIPQPELDGTIHTSEYGFGPEITRIEGQGNGSNVLDLTIEGEEHILSGANGKGDHPVYRGRRGPINVKVIDPLNVPADKFTLKFIPDGSGDLDSATWLLVNHNTNDSTYADKSISIGNEQLFPDYGFSVTIEQYIIPASASGYQRAEMLDASIEYTNPALRWLSGVSDVDGQIDQNWIRSGTVSSDPIDPYDDLTVSQTEFKDGQQEYEGILDGTWAPYQLTATNNNGPGWDVTTLGIHDLSWIHSVDIVFTDDRTRWTRCPVIEMQADPALSVNQGERLLLRQSPSVDVYGDPDNSGTMGMGWFPGYAIDLETGERLNMAFGENSWLPAENGRDMQWNPTDRLYTSTGQTLFGGMHYIWVFGNERGETGDLTRMPNYDEGAYAYGMLGSNSPGDHRRVWRSGMWTGLPLLAPGRTLFETQARVRLRVAQPYGTYATTGSNNSNPEYMWDMSNLSTTTEDLPTAEDALSLINAVPNPYYAYSSYEANKLDNRIKIVNLPVECTISIYSINGTLVRRLEKDNSSTSVDWDLKNGANIPIAGGVYLIHVDAPGIGEKVVKWFGALRPTDVADF